MTKAATELAEEVLAWSSRERIEFAERILSSVEDFAEPALKEQWDRELEKRSAEIQKGVVQGVDSDAAFEAARKALNE
jgi:putative addiction module component (TIGR02574 family)